VYIQNILERLAKQFIPVDGTSVQQCRWWDVMAHKTFPVYKRHTNACCKKNNLCIRLGTLEPVSYSQQASKVPQPGPVNGKKNISPITGLIEQS
jgi:hypothetical protein